MTLHRLLVTIRRHPFAIGGVTVVCLLLAFLYTERQPDVYQSTAKVYVTTTTKDRSGSDLVNSGLYASNIVSSVASVVGTPAVLDRVISDLNLQTTSDKLAADVTATVPLNTVIIQIDARADTAQQAAAIANAAATELTTVSTSITQPSADVESPLRLTIIQSATPPDGRTSPRPMLNLATGLFLGLVGGLALAIVLEAFRRRVRSVVEVEAATGLPVIGVLPDEDDHPAAADALRVVWASMIAAAGHAPRVLLLASASESANVPKLGSRLAHVIAETERAVVWVDADLLGGRTSLALGVSPEPGLADVLNGSVDIEETIKPWRDSSLTTVPSGTRTNELGRLFSGAAMSTVVETLKAGFETVVIDATGVSHVAEVALLGSYVHGVVLIATPSSTRTMLASSAKALTTAGLRPLGVVVDQVPERDRADFERRLLSDDDLVYSD